MNIDKRRFLISLGRKPRSESRADPQKEEFSERRDSEASRARDYESIEFARISIARSGGSDATSISEYARARCRQGH
jgi:hypothetical protein